jgi:hypothetical protein
MQKSSNLYQNLGYWFLMFIVLVIAGFYTSYLSTLFDDKPRLVHIHFMLMSLWIIMLITQPFLIKYKKRAIHRKIGKASYVLVPLVLISGFLMMRQSFYFSSELIYQEAIKTGSNLSATQIAEQAADKMGLPFLVLFQVK